MATILVGTGSRLGSKEEYRRLAFFTGATIAGAGHTLLSGGGGGLMDATIDGCLAKGGKARIYDAGFEAGAAFPSVPRTHFEDLMPRQEAMIRDSDHAVILPGGIGTTFEFFDLVVQKILQKKPDRYQCILANIQGFWDPLLSLLHQGIEEELISPTLLSKIHIVTTEKELAEALDGLPTDA